MLREIKINDLIREVENPVLIIKGSEVLTMEDVFSGVRILIDYPEDAPKQVQEEEPKPTEAQPPEKKARRKKAEIEEIVLKAWDGGKRSISEIMDLTGCTYTTVRRYIPISAKG